MGTYAREDSPFIWKKYDTVRTTNPDGTITKKAPRKPCSTGIRKDAPTKEQRDQNWADAELQYAQDLIDIRQKKFDPPPAPGKPRITLREYVKEYLHDFKAERGDGDIDSEESKARRLVAKLGDIYLADLTIQDITKYRADRITIDGVKKRTADHEVARLRVMLKKATKYIDVNPIGGRDAMGEPKWAPLRPDDFEGRSFTPDEFQRFIAAVDAADAICGVPKAEGLAVAEYAVQSMLRIGSLMRLTWGKYRDQGTDRFPFPHVVPHNAKVYIAYASITKKVQALFAALPRDTPKGLMFPSFYTERFPGRKRQGKPATAAVKRFAVWFYKVCELAGVPHMRENDGVTPHGFRHTGATWALKRGATVKQVMLMGGWKNSQLFIKTYCHEDAIDVAAASERIFGEPVRVGNVTAFPTVKARTKVSKMTTRKPRRAQSRAAGD